MAPVNVKLFCKREHRHGQLTCFDWTTLLRGPGAKRRTHRTEGDRQHRLHPAVLQRPHHALLVHQRAAGQRPELHVFDSHRHELSVRVGPKLHHEDPVRVSGFPARSRSCRGDTPWLPWLLPPQRDANQTTLKVSDLPASATP